MVLATPGFSGIVNANRERTAAHQLMAMLATARLNALTHSMSTGPDKADLPTDRKR